MSLKKKNIIKYLSEFLIVAFGVFLGIYANEWQYEKEINQNKIKTIKNIISELENNKEELGKRIKYHELIKSSLDSLLKKVPEKIKHEKYYGNKELSYLTISGWTGPGFAEFESTAFEVAKMNGVLQEMDIDLVQLISKNYNKIRSLSDFHKTIFNRMANLNSQSTVYDMVSNITIITGDNLFMEKKVFSELEDTVEKIKKIKKKY